MYTYAYSETAPAAVESFWTQMVAFRLTQVVDRFGCYNTSNSDHSRVTVVNCMMLIVMQILVKIMNN